MELSKKSELSLGAQSYVISTELAGDPDPSIQTRVTGGDGALVFQTSKDISTLRPIFQNSQRVFAQLEAQHNSVMNELKQGRLLNNETAPAAEPESAPEKESDALEHAVALLARGNFEKARAALRAVLSTFPNCSEARELLEVAYKASSEARLQVDVVAALKRGIEAFAAGRQRDAIETWKQCLIEEPSNRRLQLLVMLATTWSAERRTRYANEVLAPGSGLLDSGRSEEVQALLLLAQTVEGGPAESPVAGALPEAESSASSPVEQSQAFEEEEETMTAPPPPAAAIKPAPAPSEPMEAVKAAEVVEAVKPVQAVESTVEEPKPAPAAASRPAVARRPMRPARRSNPWPVVAAAAVVLVGVAAGVIWWLSRSESIPPEELERASSFMGSGRYAEAIAAYGGILEKYGEQAPAYLGRGRARLASGDPEGGLSDLERAHTIAPEASEIAEELGDVFYSRSDYGKAIEYFQRAFAGGAAGRGSAEARYHFAVSLVHQDRKDEAMEHLRAALEKEPSHGEAQFLYGQLLNEAGRYEEAERALRAAEPHVEAGSDFFAQLGVALLEQEKLDEAEEIARGFIRSYPNDVRGRSLLGETYLSRRQFEAARAQLIQALRIDPRDPRAQLALGRTWLAIGGARSDAQDLAKARQVLENARGVDEGRRLLALGQVALAEGKLEEAQSILRRAIEQGSPELPARLSLAEARLRSTDLVGAAEEMQRASGFDPEDPAITFSLAILYSQLQELERASEKYLETFQGVGLLTPPGEDAGPVMLPEPYIPLPERFNLGRAIKTAYEGALAAHAEDPTALQLKTLSESTTFVIGTGERRP